MKQISKQLILGLGLMMAGINIASAMDAFSDVPPNHPNFAAIMDMKTRGLISGYADGTFKPDQVVNRVEALKILLGAAKIDSTSAMDVGAFFDTDNSQWYAPYLNTAVKLGVVAGYPDGTFKPTKTVNLAENLKILLSANKVDFSKVIFSTDPYVDVSKDQWFAKYFQYAKNKSLIIVDNLGKVYPDQEMTRGKLVQVADLYIIANEVVDDSLPAPEVPTMIDTTGVNDMIMEVNVKDMAFVKADMTVGLGTRVRWTNNDSAQHSVVSDSGSEINGFVMKNGESYIHRFNTLGTFEYHCGLHSSMKGKITVKPVIEVPTI